MASSHQLSAHISPETRRELDRYAEAHGVKKGHLIEMAVLHHLQALRELPPDVVIPPRLVVSSDTGAWLLDLQDATPTPSMQALYARVRTHDG